MDKTCNNDEDAETKSVTWKMRQDPKPVTADDALSTWNAIKDPDNGTWISGSDYIDSVLMRFTDAFLSLPPFLVLILLASILREVEIPLFQRNSVLTIIWESGISFLGFGIQQPTPSWGNLIASAQDHFIKYPWLAIFPGLMIFISIISVNYIGDGLRDALDPYKVLEAVGEYT